MFKLKRIVVIVLLLLVVGLGTPQVFADGPTETPGITSGGPTETPGCTGPTETPGIIENILVYLVSTLIP